MRSFERVVAAAPGGSRGASARYRLGPVAEAGRWPVDVVAATNIPEHAEVAALLERGGTDALLILQRILPSAEQMQALRRAYGPVVFDFDDALYAVPPRVGQSRLAGWPKAAVRLALRGSPSTSARARPLARVLRDVDVCVAGNAILAAHARRHAERVVEIPTTVQPLDRPPAPVEAPIVAWMGLPDNLQYLELVVPALRRVSVEVGARVRIVSSVPWTRSGIDTEFVEWSPEAARDALVGSRVGIAPLSDSEWTRGKCALRAIQYAGHGLPVVASPVGITDRVVLHGRTGYLARSADEWVTALRELLTSRERAAELGAAGLEHVQAHYSDEVAVRRWHDVLEAL